MEAGNSSETSVDYQTKCCHIPEDGALHSFEFIRRGGGVVPNGVEALKHFFLLIYYSAIFVFIYNGKSRGSEY
jgi:hypothetical protein